MAESAGSQRLERVVRLPGAVLLGLGSIVGTGAFVSIGIAAGVAGPSVLLAIALAGLLAACNGLSSAQLAASHPVSGGTYEYGYRYLTPTLGFTAGWMFMSAKSASAATAALGLAGYLLEALGIGGGSLLVAVGLLAVLAVTALVWHGTSRSNRANAVIVGLTLATLMLFVVAGLPSAAKGSAVHLAGIFPDRAGLPGLLEATALMFVAYTGYGRIATLGEEVRDPARTIPGAIVVTLVVSALLYISVGAVAVGSVGAPRLAEMTASRAAPLEDAAMTFGGPTLGRVLALGAITAMLGVLLNLILGLSRVLLAMARRGDAPGRLATIDDVRSSPAAAVIAVGIVIGLLVLIGDVKTTWSFSAFTVLVYYALTNLAALRIPVEDRIFPRWIAVAGLTGCLGLAFWVEWRVWAVGLGMIAAGLVWRQVMRRMASRS
ncbi:MAG: APC family permease [marine benthic group bacterium]|nr:APC family permease [Gemmatimonadota bacterium]